MISIFSQHLEEAKAVTKRLSTICTLTPSTTAHQIIAANFRKLYNNSSIWEQSIQQLTAEKDKASQWISKWRKTIKKLSHYLKWKSKGYPHSSSAGFCLISGDSHKMNWSSQILTSNTFILRFSLKRIQSTQTTIYRNGSQLIIYPVGSSQKKSFLEAKSLTSSSKDWNLR
jgi:hypothetical protein